MFGQFVEMSEYVAIFTFDPDGTILHWNRGAEVAFGHRAAEIVGSPWTRLFTASDNAAGVPAHELETALATG